MRAELPKSAIYQTDNQKVARLAWLSFKLLGYRAVKCGNRYLATLPVELDALDTPVMKLKARLSSSSKFMLFVARVHISASKINPQIRARSLTFEGYIVQD